jgi:hypothetical protein
MLTIREGNLELSGGTVLPAYRPTGSLQCPDP